MLTLPNPNEDELALPKYRDPGRILFYFHANPTDPYEVEVYGYDGSAFWINEGVGCDYFLTHECSLELELSGWYVMEGIVGIYHKGTWGFDDDSEEWEFTHIRRADPLEIETEALY